MRASSTYDDALRPGRQRNLSTSMCHYIQYRNGDKEGFNYLFADDDRFGIYTRCREETTDGLGYLEGRALPNLPWLDGFGVSFGCLGFFFSLRRSLFPI